MDKPAWATFLLRFGELALKGPPVRRRFERRLVANIERSFERAKVGAVLRTDWGRIVLETADADAATRILSRTFGLVSASPVQVGDATLEDSCRLAVHVARATVRPGASFAVRARRTGTHPFTSTGLARAAGAAILGAIPSATVELGSPDVEVFVEVRNAAAYAFSEHIHGPGGLPRGSQGRVTVACTGPAILPAAWLVAKRGPEPVFVVPPRPGVRALRPLAPYLEDARVLVLPDAPWSREGVEAAAVAAANRIKARAVVYDHDARAALAAPPTPGPAALRPLVGWIPGTAPSVPAEVVVEDTGPWVEAKGRTDGAEALADATEVTLQ